MSDQNTKVAIFWFRRDLRLSDNVGLTKAHESGYPVLPIFIFDSKILNELPADDARVSFIYKRLQQMHMALHDANSGLNVFHGNPSEVFTKIVHEYDVAEVYTNRDYEPYARERDSEISMLLERKNIALKTYKDQVIVEQDEVVKADGKPYTVYTPFKNKWLQLINLDDIVPFEIPAKPNWFKGTRAIPSLQDIGFIESKIKVKDFTLAHLADYAETRNLPAVDQTSYLSPHLRFGTIGIRTVFEKVKHRDVFISELIWREFFMQILYHYPEVVEHNFKRKYDGIEWENNESDFEKWCAGKTGYPMVDAGMRQLNKTGYMHNRVRMVTASFLCKHLLIDWKWGEAYFASKLLDYELASNNGNWQWSAGTGCDAAPYFRVFNPMEQHKKFDPESKYVKKWIPELLNGNYPAPMIDHKIARQRALDRYKSGLN